MNFQLKTKKIISFALLLIFVSSNFIFLTQKGYAETEIDDTITIDDGATIKEPTADDTMINAEPPGTFTPELDPNAPITNRDPNTSLITGLPIGSVCRLNVGGILGGVGGLLSKAGSAIYQAGEWLDTTISGPDEDSGTGTSEGSGEVLDTGTTLPGGDNDTISAFTESGDSLGGIMGLVSGASGGPGSALGALGGGASVPTFDTGLNPKTEELVQKEKCLDPIVKMMARFLIRKIVDDLARWIRGGMNGKPRFIQDFGKYMLEAADIAGGLVFEEILGKNNAKLLCEPWRADINIDIFLPRNKFKFKAQCRISQILDAAQQAGVDIDIDVDRRQRRNLNTFNNNFNAGGWPGFLTMLLEDGSNAPGLFLSTAAEKTRKQAEAQTIKTAEAQINQGMLPGVCIKKQGISGWITIPGTNAKDANNKEVCVRSEFLSPGTALAEMIGDTFLSPLRQFELADEFNELLAAFIDALRMGRFWNNGVAEPSEPDVGFYGEVVPHGWVPDNTIVGNEIRAPKIISPKGKAVITGPIKFDWKDFEGQDAVKYLLVIDFPDGITQRFTVTPCEENADSLLTECQQTETAFNDLSQAGIYSWQIAAIDENENVIGAFSEPTKFKIPAPNIKSPGDGKLFNEKVVLDWGPGDLRRVDYYEVIIIHPDEHIETIRIDNGTKYIAEGAQFDAMEPGEYLWKVAGFDSAGKIIGRHSEELSFKVLKKPVPETPSENAEISFPYTFNWQDAIFAESYEIRIKKRGGDFKKFDIQESEIEISEEPWANPTGDFIWQVRISATQINGKTINSLWSEQRSFTVSAASASP